MSLITSFYFVTVLMLVYNTYRDFKKSMIDERYNYFALGSTIMLVSYLNPGLIIYLYIFLAIFIQIVAKKLLAEGDMMPIFWIMLGFGAIGVTKLITWLVIWGFYTFFYVLFLKKEKIQKYPYYMVFLVSYVITIFI